MFTLNGHATAVPHPPAAPPAGPPADTEERYETELVTLLGRLEHLREGLMAARAANRLSQAITLAEDMMAQVTGFAERHPYVGTRDVTEAEARAGEFRTWLAHIRDPHGPGPRISAGRGGRGADDGSGADAVRRCFWALYESVVAYFVSFTSRFATSKAARGWVEVAAGFMVDLKRLADEPVPA